jgi:hypothetical protein
LTCGELKKLNLGGYSLFHQLPARDRPNPPQGKELARIALVIIFGAAGLTSLMTNQRGHPPARRFST